MTTEERLRYEGEETTVLYPDGNYYREWKGPRIGNGWKMPRRHENGIKFSFQQGPNNALVPYGFLTFVAGECYGPFPDLETAKGVWIEHFGEWVETNRSKPDPQPQPQPPAPPKLNSQRWTSDQCAPSVVYFLDAEGISRVKIGTTTNLDVRLRDIQATSPVLLKLRGCIPGCKQEEARIHRRFAHLRWQHEWFQKEYSLEQFIVEVLTQVETAFDRNQSHRIPEVIYRLSNSPTG